MSKIKWAWMSILTLMILVSCGEVGPQKRAGTATSLGSLLDSAQVLSGKEMEIAYTMCLALRNKSTEFRSKHLNQIFSFDIEYMGCNRLKSSTVISTRLNESNGVLLYDSPLATFYFKKVETHAVGLLSPVCGALLKGESANNTFDEPDGKRQFKFYVEDGRAKIISHLGKRDMNNQSPTFGQFVISKEDIKIIDTGPVLPGVIIGMESEQTQRIPCPDGVTFESIRQVFLTHSVD